MMLCAFDVSILFITVLIVTASTVGSTDICELPSCQPATLPSGSHIGQLCDEQNYNISGRCCMAPPPQNHTRGNIVGLDLTTCNLTSLDLLQEQDISSLSGVWDRTQLIALSLENNAVNDTDTEQFADMVSLDYLSLPPLCQCPGGNDAWNSTKNTSTATVCLQQVDICQVDNVDCPENSHCVMHSPGVQWCACNDSYHGYKCLRQGQFPVVELAVGLSATTFVLSVSGYVILRRNTHPVR